MSKISRCLLQQLQHYWEGKRAGADVPRRAAIDPVEIPFLLPHLVLVDVVYADGTEPADFAYRLWGERVIEQNRRSLVGRRLSDLVRQDPIQQWFVERFNRVVAERAPLLDSTTYVTVGETVKTFDIAILPLAGAGTRIETLMAGVVYRVTPELLRSERRAWRLSAAD